MPLANSNGQMVYNLNKPTLMSGVSSPQLAPLFFYN